MPPFAIADLLRPDAFPHPVRGPECVETHISWVLLTGEWAYKIKKPVRLDFIDASTLARRRELCEEELRLNRRLAPELYQGVVSIGWRDGRLQVGAEESVVEYAVRMRQFDRSLELAALLTAQAVGSDEVCAFAAGLAGFHAGLAPAPAGSAFGGFAQVREAVLANLGPLLGAAAAGELHHELEALEEWTRTRLAASEGEIESRRREGAVRECHGDLHARNIVRWNGRLLAFDCLEFDPNLRWIDVASELAFLYMDLLSYARTDLASLFLSRYLEQSGDYAGLRLLRFYAVHRALVRARVDLLQGLQERCAQRVRTAHSLAQAPDPFLLLTCGVSGSGKSWLSERLVTALGAVRVRSDLERPRISGSGAPQRYGTLATGRTYARLLECADAALAGGQNVIVDAAFLDRGQRDLFFGLARERRVRLLIVACQAQLPTLRERIERRAAAGADPSEATAAVLERQLELRHALGARERDSAIEIDTTAMVRPEVAIEAIRRRLAGAGIP